MKFFNKAKFLLGIKSLFYAILMMGCIAGVFALVVAAGFCVALTLFWHPPAIVYAILTGITVFLARDIYKDPDFFKGLPNIFGKEKK
jgi:hypothetical protein